MPYFGTPKRKKNDFFSLYLKLHDSLFIIFCLPQILWVTGGFDGNSSTFTKTTEFVQLDKPTENGPDLPEEYYYHCMTNFNETLVLVLGGYSTAQSTLLVDVSSKVVIKSGLDRV